jgi:hypothetical protein
MEDTSGYDASEYETVEDPGYGATTYRSTDPISSFINLVGFIIILGLIIILVVVLMIGKGFGLVTDAATGAVKKEGFQMPTSGPRPRAEYDARCADFPAI